MIKDICFLILHYNTIAETMRCVQSIKALDEQERIRIVIVDNASPNQSGKELEQLFDKDDAVVVLQQTTNTGFSRGNNAGYQYIKENENPLFLIVANNDIEFPQKDFIARIEGTYRQNHFSLMGPDIYNPIKKIHQSPLGETAATQQQVSRSIRLNRIALKYYALSYPLMELYFSRNGKKSVQGYEKLRHDVCLTGACLIYSKDFTDGADRIFPIETEFYYEENLLYIWCMRHRKKMIYQPDIEVLHMEGRATKSLTGSRRELIRRKMKLIIAAAEIYRNYLSEE